MCRWLVYHGDLVSLASLLIYPTNSLVNQAGEGSYTPGAQQSSLYRPDLHHIRNHGVNADGFGIAWYSPPPSIRIESSLFKSIQPAWSDKNLSELAEVLHSNTVFAHIRAASPGLVVSRENCHPFKYGRYTFMHNGGIAGFASIKRRLRTTLRDDLYLMIQGTTDSEHAFAVFLNQLPDASSQVAPEVVGEALEACIKFILKAQKECGVQGASSLNFAVTDGTTVAVSRFRNAREEDPPTLYYAYGSDFAMDKDKIFRVGRSEPKDTLLVSSEPLTDVESDWTMIPKDHMLLAQAEKGENSVVVKGLQIKPISY